METTTRTELGDIHISDRAISVIAAQRASAVAHVKGLEGSLADAAARKFGHENRAQGIEAKLDGNRAELTVRLIVESGCRIPDVALQVQKSVKDGVESFTGCTVTAVHIIVTGLSFPDERQVTD